MKQSYFLALICVVCFACEKGESNNDDGSSNTTIVLNPIADVCVDYPSESTTISVSQNIENKDITVIPDDTWVRNFKITGNTISFDVLENTERTRGYRSLKVKLMQNDKEIGIYSVFQTRRPTSEGTMIFANSNATTSPLIPVNITNGLDATKYVYNLEKTTSGRDSYKNYPAFAFCIEMNHDPENNMEWFLPSNDEITEGKPYYNDFKKLYDNLDATLVGRPYFWGSLGGGTQTAIAYQLSQNGVQFVGMNAYSNKSYYVIALKKK